MLSSILLRNLSDRTLNLRLPLRLPVVLFFMAFRLLGPDRVGAQSPPDPIDFKRDIEPILREKCVGCHGPDLQHGGLRIDEQKFAAAGGHSQKIVLGGTLETNEIQRRIVATDPAIRMPKNAPPLSVEERERIARWIQDGSPWPVEIPPPERDDENKKRTSITEASWWKWIDLSELYLIRFRVWVGVGMVVLAFIAIAERYQDSTRKARERAASLGEEVPSVRFPRLLRVTRSHYLNLVLLVLLGAALDRLWRSPPLLTVAVTQASRQTEESTPRERVVRAGPVYGMPPRPFRPHHPRQLNRVYYRGNCERNEQLYNGGNYQTARFLLRLCDKSGNEVQVGEEIPEGGLFVELRMERSAGTHEGFYAPQTIQAIALSRQVFTQEAKKPDEPLVRLEVVKPDWIWQTRFPLGRPVAPDSTEWAGTVYVYRGTTEEAMKTTGTFGGEFHYAIVCELKLEQGKITAESDLWMGSLFIVPVLEFPTPGKVQLDEWFDFRPIPEIVGENTTKDPKLLGLPATGEGGTEGTSEGGKE